MKGLLYIFLLLLSPEVFAGLFDPPPTDQSVRMLGIIFGSNIGNISLGGAPNPVLSSIMEKFNFFIVTVGTIVVSYVGIMSTINTAQEGAAMGKKWSAIWIPMRSIAGMALMIPSPASGYSMIQITVLWIILQGIGAADQIWNIALDGLKKGASAMTGIKLTTDPQIKEAAEQLTPLILNAAICMEALNNFGNTGTDHVNTSDWLNQKGSYIKHFSKRNPPGTDSNKVSGVTYFGVDDPTDTEDWHKSICGAINVTGEATAEDYAVEDAPSAAELAKAAELIYDTKQLAISSMLTVLKPLAEGIVDGTIQKPMKNGTPDPAGYYQAATDAYISILSGLIVPTNTLSGAGSTEFKNAIRIAEQKGWIVAGSYYFVFNKTLETKMYQNAKKRPEIVPGPYPRCPASPFRLDCEKNGYEGKIGLTPNDLAYFNKIPLTTQELIDLTKYLAYGNVFLEADMLSYRYSNTLGFNASMAQGSNPAVAAFSTQSYEMAKGLAKLLEGTPGADPLMTHAWFGRDLMQITELLWITMMSLTLAMGIGLWAASFWTGGSAGFMIGFVATVIGMILPVLALVWSFGAMLAIYAPLIPFMIFTTAAIGWLLTVIEAIIAAPLIALGLVTPSGDELGKLETALMILANIFLRPMLMVFGFLLAGRLFNAVVSLIDLGMLEIFKTINVSTLFSWVVMFAAYISFFISCTNTCFSLIYAVPDKILRWLGGPAENTDTSAAREAKGMTQSAASGVGQGGSAIAGTGAKGVGNKAKENIENRKKLEEQKKGSTE